MSYYLQGDYYSRPMRGMMRGDPGFFSFLGGIAKSALGGVTNMLTGGLSGVAESALAGPTSAAVGWAAPAMTMKKLSTKMAARAAAVARAHPGSVAAAGAAAAGLGYEAIKHRKKLEHMVGIGTGGRRRMNVTNVRALRRSIRRCQGFAKLAKRVLRFTSPRPPRGRVTFKHRARKKVC